MAPACLLQSMPAPQGSLSEEAGRLGVPPPVPTFQIPHTADAGAPPGPDHCIPRGRLGGPGCCSGRLEPSSHPSLPSAGLSPHPLHPGLCPILSAILSGRRSVPLMVSSFLGFYEECSPLAPLTLRLQPASHRSPATHRAPSTRQFLLLGPARVPPLDGDNIQSPNWCHPPCPVLGCPRVSSLLLVLKHGRVAHVTQLCSPRTRSGLPVSGASEGLG